MHNCPFRSLCTAEAVALAAVHLPRLSSLGPGQDPGLARAATDPEARELLPSPAVPPIPQSSSTFTGAGRPGTGAGCPD